MGTAGEEGRFPIPDPVRRSLPSHCTTSMAARALATLKAGLRLGGWQDSLLLAYEQLESQPLFGLLPHLAHGRLGEPLASFRSLARSPIRATAAAWSGIRYTDGCCATAGCRG